MGRARRGRTSPRARSVEFREDGVQSREDKETRVEEPAPASCGDGRRPRAAGVDDTPQKAGHSQTRGGESAHRPGNRTRGRWALRERPGLTRTDGGTGAEARAALPRGRSSWPRREHSPPTRGVRPLAQAGPCWARPRLSWRRGPPRTRAPQPPTRGQVSGSPRPS